MQSNALVGRVAELWSLRGVHFAHNYAMTASLLAALTGFDIVALLMLAVPVALVGFWLWMLIDCATHETAQDSQKVVWVLIVIFVPLLGALLYYLIRKMPRDGRRVRVNLGAGEQHVSADIQRFAGSERFRAVLLAIGIVILIMLLSRFLIGRE